MSNPALPFVAPGAAQAASLASGAPGAPGAPALLLDLEAAHTALRLAALALEHEVEPLLDLRPAARALERAFGALYDAWDRRADGLVSSRAALDHAAAAGAALAPRADDPAIAAVVAQIAEARRHLEAAEARFSRMPPALPPEPQEVLASIDVPRLHRLDRPSLTPSLRVPEAPAPPPPPPDPIPPAKTFEELAQAIATLKERSRSRRPPLPPSPSGSTPGSTPPRVAPPEGRVGGEAPFTAPAVPAAVPEFRWGRARECFEEIAMVGMQRVPLLGDPWRGYLVLERRMLAAIDVLAAIGAVAVAHLPRLFADAPIKDPSHGFALAMALGCFAGRDALAAAEHALLGGEREPDFVEQVGAALKIVPHDALPIALRALLREADPRIRAMAIDVLGYRGLASPDELLAAARDAAPVASRALLYLCVGGSQVAGGIGVLDEIGVPEDPELRRAVWTAMAIAGRPRASATLRAALQDPDDSDAAALLLAIAGDEGDARAVVERAVIAPRPGLVAATGWTGAGWAIDRLVDLLEHDDEHLRAAAGEALARITGAEIWEVVEVPAEEIHVPDPPDPDVGERRAPKLAHVVSDPRDLPPAPAPDRVERPSTDPARWRAWLRDHDLFKNVNARYRRGQLYTPLVSLGELDRAPCTFEERRLLQRELIVRTGGHVRFDPHDLVAVQEEAIRAWEPIARRASAAPGQWSRPYR